MKYKLLIHQQASKELGQLDKGIQERIKNEIKKKLTTTPELGKHLKHCRFWRLRVGEYRVIYEIKDKEVMVLWVGHRDDAYYDFSKLF